MSKARFKLPNEIIKIENADKKFHETWHLGRDICDFLHLPRGFAVYGTREEFPDFLPRGKEIAFLSRAGEIRESPKRALSGPHQEVTNQRQGKDTNLSRSH